MFELERIVAGERNLGEEDEARPSRCPVRGQCRCPTCPCHVCRRTYVGGNDGSPDNNRGTNRLDGPGKRLANLEFGAHGENKSGAENSRGGVMQEPRKPMRGV